MTLKRVGDRPIQYQADTHSNLLDQAVFTVRSVNEAVWDGANQPVTAVLSNYELLFLLEGEAAFTQKDYHSDARTGDVVLLSPFTPYIVCPVEGQPLRCLSIHFLLSPSYMERVFDGMFHSKSGLAVKPSDPNAIHTLMQMLLESWNAGSGNAPALARAVLYAVLPQMADESFDPKAEPYAYTRSQADLIDRAVRLAAEGLAGPVRIQSLVRHLGVSESRLNKTFNDVLGIPPSRYFMNMKMRRVEEMVAFTDMTMEEISSGMGFSSAFHLSRAYKDTFGVSPSQFRKQFRMGFVK